MRKLEALIEYINLFDWIFWIDDDAYFTDFNIPIENFIDNEFNFIVCNSPSSKKIFTKISSGQFLIKNTDKAKKFLEAGLMIDLEEVKKWWSKEFGLFTKGDQDVMVYLMETNPDFSNFFYKILDHNMFNNREYEYREKIDEHFLVHFTGKNKKIDKSNFCTRLQCNEYISPADMLYELSLR